MTSSFYNNVKMNNTTGFVAPLGDRRSKIWFALLRRLGSRT